MNGRYPVPVRHWDYLLKRNQDPRWLLLGTMSHEGDGTVVRPGHQRQIEKALTADACGDVAAIAEGVVAENHARAGEVLWKQVERIAAFAFAQASHHHMVYGHHGSAGSPIVWWTPGRIPIVTVYRDEQKPDPGYYASGCDWLSF